MIKRPSTHTLLLEAYILKQAKKKRPAICFIPTASGESPKYIADFYKAFSLLDCLPSHLSLFEPPSSDLESFLLEKEVIYVGGGNTKSMLALWKEWKIDQILRKAYEKGILLSGVSAGANCWFDSCVTDSIPGHLTSLPCLGFLKGSCCPHYDGEKERRPSYHNLLKDGEISSGIAIDDFAAVHFKEGKVINTVRTNATGRAYWVSHDKGSVQESPLESTPL